MNQPDYLIVGAGSAGCVLANRLSANPNTTVMLLEAGGSDDKPEIRIPYSAATLQKSEVDWAYETDSQPHLGGRTINFPRGKVLGGTSAINAMVYIRGHRGCYDSWRDAGNSGWGYNDLLPYFKRSEHNERGADLFHGVGGGLNVADQRDANPLSCALIEAATELGCPINPDFNGERQTGFGFYQATQKEGERWSSAAAFLHPIRQRQNLTVHTQAHVTRLLLAGKRCVGVAYWHDGSLHEIRVRREVILCAGAINSPQLLLLSGIGGGGHLQAMGIPVMVNLPGVGQNLQDHCDVPVAYACTEPITLGIVTAAAELEYRYFRKGPLASGGPEAGGFLRTQPHLPVPDLQFHFAPGWSVGFGPDRPALHGFALWPALVAPNSRGSLQLTSPDPLVPPLIQPNYLAEASDVAVLVAGVKLGRRLAQTQAFAPFLGEAIKPTPDVQSDVAIEGYVRQNLGTVYHPTGTCKMGGDEMAVVDAQLRVRGVLGLRVADAAIMPAIVNGNTNAPAIMIGEKAADLILESA